MSPRVWILAATIVLGLSVSAFYFTPRFFGFQAAADSVASEVATLRGLPLKRRIPVKHATPAEFGDFVTRQLRAQALPAAYGDIVRMLGLYRGPRIEDPNALVRRVLDTVAGGYYDVERKQIALLRDFPDARRKAAIAHEMYHALQDQYFDLAKYYAGARNADEQLARRAVVEGEASYIQTMFATKDPTGNPLPLARLHLLIDAQPVYDRYSLPELLRTANVRTIVGEDSFAAIRSFDELPAFMWETLSGNAVLGMKFIDAIRPRGWPEIEKLYREQPPASTEQILHPAKWTAGEAPVAIEWPAFQGAPFAGQRLLQEGVIGEFQWRLIFRENGFTSADAAGAADGWGGDRYAVFKDDRSGKLLMLLYTSWDTDVAASKFALAYRRAQGVKYSDGLTPTRVVEAGRDVMIAEGGDESSLSGFVQFLGGMRAERARTLQVPSELDAGAALRPKR